MAERLEEIRETVRFMRQRLESGQGDRTSAMCRLSLTMAEDLLMMLLDKEDRPE